LPNRRRESAIMTSERPAGSGGAGVAPHQVCRAPGSLGMPHTQAGCPSEHVDPSSRPPAPAGSRRSRPAAAAGARGPSAGPGLEKPKTPIARRDDRSHSTLPTTVGLIVPPRRSHAAKREPSPPRAAPKPAPRPSRHFGTPGPAPAPFPSPLAGEVAQLGPTARSAAGRGVPPAHRPLHLPPRGGGSAARANGP
jgi:hypothetical protein